MDKRKQRVAVIGSGVIGLTSAYRLLDAGFAVTVLARVLPPQTTSDVAAAFWSPTAAAGDATTRAWALEGLRVLRELVTVPESGIAIVDLYKLAAEATAMPYLAHAGEVTAVPAGHFPAPWSGYTVPVPRIDVPIYMPWLAQQVVEKGGVIQQQIVQQMGELTQQCDLIINCSGLGARLLTGDDVYPIRGQVISVRKPEGLTTDIIYADTDHEITTYIIPRSQDCLLGGTYQDRDGNTEVDEALARDILARCAIFNPTLQDAEILQHKVGLRPGRASVRLETERLRSGQWVIHNYGHGSVGHTLAWGCAAAVLQQTHALWG
jgi:D-amino-acid oxidase